MHRKGGLGKQVVDRSSNSVTFTMKALLFSCFSIY